MAVGHGTLTQMRLQTQTEITENTGAAASHQEPQDRGRESQPSHSWARGSSGPGDDDDPNNKDFCKDKTKKRNTNNTKKHNKKGGGGDGADHGDDEGADGGGGGPPGSPPSGSSNPADSSSGDDEAAAKLLQKAFGRRWLGGLISISQRVRPRKPIKVSFPNIPDNITKLPAWQECMRSEVGSASGFGTKAAKWIDEVEDIDKLFFCLLALIPNSCQWIIRQQREQLAEGEIGRTVRLNCEVLKVAGPRG